MAVYSNAPAQMLAGQCEQAAKCRDQQPCWGAAVIGGWLCYQHGGYIPMAMVAAAAAAEEV